MQTDEESETFDIQKGSKQGDPLSSLLFNTVLQYALKNVVQKWQKKGMGIYLSDQERDCLTNLRFADDVMLFATSKGQMQNMMCEFKEATEKVGLTIHPNKTKILSNESSMNSDTRRYMKIGDMDIEILAKSESVKYLGQRISFLSTGDTRDQEQDQSSMDNIPEIQTGINIEEIHAQTPPASLRRHGLSDSLLRIWNMVTEPRTRKE